MGVLGAPSVRQVVQEKVNAQNMQRTSCDAVEMQTNEDISWACLIESLHRMGKSVHLEDEHSP
jgi:hypothetical protein